MRVWVELSGEHATLPRAEALAALEAERVAVRTVSWSRQVLRFDAEGPVMQAIARLGLAHVACEEIAAGDFDTVREAARTVDLARQGFRTRVRSLGPDVDSKAIEGPLGADLGRTGHVDLVHPDVDFRVLVDDAFHLGRVLVRTERSSMESRKVDRRPFSLPISLHPKYCRALVNLARVPSHGTVLDPFCGTGGILIEAAGMGLRSIGSDLRRRMVVGARTSLRSLSSEADLAVADAGRAPWRPGAIQGVATDPPYGRAASTKGEPPLRLYDRAFAAFREMLHEGGYAAVVLPNDAAVETAQSHMELVERHALRVHRSLTRQFCAFVR